MGITSNRQHLLGGAQRPSPPAAAAESLSPWRLLRRRYEIEALPKLSRRTGEIWAKAVARFEKICQPKTLDDLTDATLTEFAAGLQADGYGRSSIRNYVSRIRQALKFACEAGLIDSGRFRLRRHGPKFRWPKSPHGTWTQRELSKWIT